MTLDDLIALARSVAAHYEAVGAISPSDQRNKRLATGVLTTLVGPRTSSLRAEVVELARARRNTRCARYPGCAGGYEDGEAHDFQCPLARIEQDLTAAIDALAVAEADERTP